jgi:hypothetical protein
MMVDLGMVNMGQVCVLPGYRCVVAFFIDNWQVHN